MSSSSQRESRLDLLVSLFLMVSGLAAFFALGSGIQTVASAVPYTGPVSMMAGAPWQLKTLSLATIARTDSNGRNPFAPIESLFTLPTGQLISRPMFDWSWSGWSPVQTAQVSWLSCAAALAFLALRFVLVPIALRIGGGDSRSSPDSSRAAAIAADYSVASCAIAFALWTVLWCCGMFVFCAFGPEAWSGPLARAAPFLTTGFMVFLPPLFVANEIRGDRSRRVFAAPWRIATIAVVVYLAALAATLGFMAAAFRGTMWLLA
ncbi:MAG: hypothetical protein SGJ09_08555 [Phycisphaerae bacterium]|nr:hypothetical protein [Phycisphaerae bacterium]